MSNLIRKATSLQELNSALEEIYESRRLQKQKKVQENILSTLFKDNENIKVKNQEKISYLLNADELMDLIYGYQEDIFERGSLRLVKAYKETKSLYKEFEKKLAQKYDGVLPSEEEYKELEDKLQVLLAGAIKQTQLHLILLDEEPELNKAKKLCDLYLSVSPLDNVLIQYHSGLNLQQVYTKYINIPSIYVYLGNKQDLEASRFFGTLKEIINSFHPHILKCFVTDCLRHEKRENISKTSRFQYVENSSELFRQVKWYINQSKEIQIIQCLSIEQAYQLENTLAFLKIGTDLTSTEQLNCLMELKTEIMNEYSILTTSDTNKTGVYFRFVEAISKCFKEENEPQQLCQRILSNFIQFRQFINKIISQDRTDLLINSYKNLISTVIHAYNLYDESENLNIKSLSNDSLFSSIIIPKAELQYFKADRRFLLPRFTYFYISLAKAVEEAPSYSNQTHALIILGYKFMRDDKNMRKTSSFKTFKDKDGLTAIMSLPTTVFEVACVYNEGFYKCLVALLI